MVRLPPIAGARILALRAGALGDTILTLPALAALRRAVGKGGSVAFVGSEPANGLALDDEHASEVVSIDRGWFRALFDVGADDAELLRFLARFQIVVAWSRLPLLGEKLARLGIAGVSGPPMPPHGRHASDHLLSILAPLGVDSDADAAPRISTSSEHRRRAHEFLKARRLQKRRFVALHPGSGSPRKNWPCEHFEAVAGLARGAGLEILWVEGQAEAALVPDVASRSGGAVARRLALPTLGAVLQQSAVYIGNDSGVSHLAAAVGASSLVVFGPTDPEQWAPRGRNVRVVNWPSSPRIVWAFARERMIGR